MIRADVRYNNEQLPLTFMMKGRVSGNTLRKTDDSMMAVMECIHDALKHALIGAIHTIELSLTKSALVTP